MFKKRIQPLSMKEIQVTDDFFGSYLKIVREEMLPYQWAALNDSIEGAEPSYCIENFKIAAGLSQGQHRGWVFQDSDLYKYMEGAAYSLMWAKDDKLEGQLDDLIDLLEMAQEPDGYLNTYYSIQGLEGRFTNLKDHHELYCLGHMIEAAVAYFAATGKTKFLDLARKNVACVATYFGPDPDKQKGYPGHEVIEMALVGLYQVTGDLSYLDLAKYFIMERGQAPNYFEEEDRRMKRDNYWDRFYTKYQYYQAGRPVLLQEEPEGHAVRAVYLYAGMADVAYHTKDQALQAACERLFDRMVTRQMYITGGIGPTFEGEAFTFDYDLPNDTAYAETCASIGLAFFTRRMFENTGDAKYMAVLERALYNGIISGMTLDGKRFFYVNPLSVNPEACLKDPNKRHVKAERQKWFGCACCPPNLARFLASLGSYAYHTSDDTLYVNLYIGADLRPTLRGHEVPIKALSTYPYEGHYDLTFMEAVREVITIGLRKPTTAQAYQVLLNGSPVDLKEEKGYLYVTESFMAGDTLSLNMTLKPTYKMANSRVSENLGKIALTYGPLVYCLEEADNGQGLARVYLDPEAKVEKDQMAHLNQVMTLKTKGYQKGLWDQVKDGTDLELYRDYEPNKLTAKELTFIPYFAWANRHPGEMEVWLPNKL